jgi:DNA-binding Xre family transcriptional regulator
MTMMMTTKPQTFTAPDGTEMAVLPMDDYNRLVAAAEMAEDVAAYDEAKRALDAGEDELIPFEMTERMAAGESPVRVWREHRGLKATELAARAGLSPSYLSQIESGQRDGTFAIMAAIAAALDVTLDDLAPANPAAD